MTGSPISPIRDDAAADGGVATATATAGATATATATAERPAVAAVPDTSLQSLEKQITLLVRRTMESVWANGYGPNSAVDRYTYPAMVLLDDDGAMSLTELTGRLGVSKPTASRQVSRLSRAGLVEVTPRACDPRSVNVALTDAGREARAEVREARLAPLREVIQHWPEADRRDLAGLLGRFTGDLDRFVR
ncbi:MarR family winged helix-turn-helix transcriptional regulator [Pseudonocardia phyllosphaerae]|uniref:MarR family winged helix-turn-helix transcriptional regulator n=1 Tax=Pseudonocardia phyllosphaerae TaxID=3390502 RepID=UPI003979A132